MRTGARTSLCADAQRGIALKIKRLGNYLDAYGECGAGASLYVKPSKPWRLGQLDEFIPWDIDWRRIGDNIVNVH